MQQQNIRLLATSVLASLAFVFCMAVGKAQATPCEAEPTDMSVAYGEQIECDINPTTDTDLYRFSGETGDRILAETLDISGTSFHPLLELVGPDGNTVGSANVTNLDIELTQTGTYTVKVYDHNRDTAGEYRFSVSCSAGPCNPSSLPPDEPGQDIECELEPTDMAVGYGQQITCGITPSQDTDLYRFSGETGDRILAETLDISGTSFHPLLELVGPGGNTVGNANVTNLDIELTQTGTYTVKVYDHNRDTTGEYRFSVSCLAGNCPPLICEDQTLEQFCNAIDATTALGARICKKADWQNDEPLMKGSEADCKVDRGGPGSADDLCVPN